MPNLAVMTVILEGFCHPIPDLILIYLISPIDTIDLIDPVDPIDPLTTPVPPCHVIAAEESGLS
jgi:hypothetical protein